MKKITYALLTLLMVMVWTSCSEDKLSPTSVIIDSQQEENEFDRWLYTNYVVPYNIELIYHMKDIEVNMSQYVVPADYNKSIRLAKLAKFLCLEAYDEVTGSTAFIRANYPKLLHFIGSAAYNNNGTMLLGVAAGANKISLYYVNAIQLSADVLNEFYIRTMHHEFTHILNQTKDYSQDFDKVTPTVYLNDSWINRTEEEALKLGLITPYAGAEPREDFAEMSCKYVTLSPAEWESKLAIAEASGAALINQKLDIVKAYYATSWGIDLDALRNSVMEREAKISTMDWDSLN